jgi:hypothetical protein
METQTVQPIIIQQPTRSMKIIGSIILLILVAIGGFFGGVLYQKGQIANASQSLNSGQNGMMGMRGGFTQNGAIGVVLAITNSSISVKDQRTNTTKTFAINSATQITKDNTTIGVTTISLNDTVLISASNAMTAIQISVNPAQGNGFSRGMMSGNAATE